jgi:hypothetical protein
MIPSGDQKIIEHRFGSSAINDGRPTNPAGEGAEHGPRRGAPVVGLGDLGAALRTRARQLKRKARGGRRRRFSPWSLGFDFFGGDCGPRSSTYPPTTSSRAKRSSCDRRTPLVRHDSMKFAALPQKKDDLRDP